MLHFIAVDYFQRYRIFKITQVSFVWNTLLCKHISS